MPPGASREETAELARVLNSSAIHLLRSLRSVDERSGLTPARLSALSVLHFGGPRPLGQLARDEGVSSPTMSRIVDGLAELGLAVRQQHPENGRIVTVAATPAGRRVMRAGAERRVGTIADAVETLPPAQQRALHRAAEALVALTEALRARAPRAP